VYAISFSELGDFFVTSGVRHVKFWYIDADSAKSKHDVTLPIKGRAGLLGELRSHTFCDVVCGVGNNSNYTYCVTTAGALCCFNAKRKLEKFVEIGSSKALCMVADDKFLICGYNNGFIRIFDSGSLEFITTLPKPHYLGVNIADGIHPSHMVAKTDSVTYGDTVAIALDSSHHR
ncbi:WD repeat-containing protein 62, partial [Exaiptasia diaphana]